MSDATNSQPLPARCELRVREEFTDRHGPEADARVVKLLTDMLWQKEHCQKDDTANDDTVMEWRRFFDSPDFDPNADFTNDRKASGQVAMHIRLARGETGDVYVTYHMPILNMIYAGVRSDAELAHQLHEKDVVPDGLVFANGEAVIDPNGNGSYMAEPLLSSVINYGWNILPLLKHPEINPNLAPSQLKHSFYEFGQSSTADEIVLRLTPNGFGQGEGETLLEMLCFRMEYRIRFLGLSDTDKDLLRNHCINAIGAMIDAGAIITPESKAVCQRYPQLTAKLEAIDTRLNALFSGEADDVTILDFKHAYATGRLRELLMHAMKDEVYGRNLLELNSEVPSWLKDSTYNAFSMLANHYQDIWQGNITEPYAPITRLYLGRS